MGCVKECDKLVCRVSSRSALPSQSTEQKGWGSTQHTPWTPEARSSFCGGPPPTPAPCPARRLPSAQVAIARNTNSGTEAVTRPSRATAHSQAEHRPQGSEAMPRTPGLAPRRPRAAPSAWRGRPPRAAAPAQGPSRRRRTAGPRPRAA